MRGLLTPDSPDTTPNPAREAIGWWALVLLVLAVFKYGVASWVPFGGALTGALAVAAFLWVPAEANRRAGRPDEDYGLNRRGLGKDVVFALTSMAIVFPLFILAFRLFLHASDEWLAPDVGRLLTPYGTSGRFVWRLPNALADVVGGNIAVAIGEEYFYRGYMQTRFAERWPARRRLWGAPFGRALLLQTAFFALGHLLTPQPFRLATFFPGLWFGWMATKTGRIVAPAIAHAASNILIATLEASAFGG